MTEQVHKFQMEMTCTGCENAAIKVVKKLEGIKNVEASFNTKTVLVTSALPPNEILEALKNTGKTITYLGSE